MPYLIAKEGPLKGLVLDLEQGDEWVIGRDPDEADLVIEDSSVSRKHVRAFKAEDGVFLKNLSRTNPTQVNGEPVKADVPLMEGDIVKIGNTFLTYSKEVPSSEKKSQNAYDDIFGDLEEPELPPEPEPLEAAASEEPEKEEKAPEEEEGEEAPAKSAYDTIFEDLGAETEMPFSLLAETPLVLKVIGGPNAGAEIGLEKERSYLVGKDSNSCDIVFQDLSVSRNHARLTISQDGIIELEDLGSKNSTLVNGAPISEKQTITSQDLIAMGTTIFLIIDREAVQETIYSPALPAYEAARTAEKVLLETGEEKDAPLAAKKATDWREQKIPSRFLAIGSAIAAIFLIIFMSFFSLFKSEGIEVSQKEQGDAIKEALEKFKGVQHIYNPASGKLFLAGHVLNSVDFQEMQYTLSQIDIASIENNVVIDEGVMRSTNEILDAHPDWQGVRIAVLEPGRFAILGYVKTSEQAANIEEYLSVNFPYTDLLQNRLVVEDLLDTQLKAMLLAHGFGAVTVQLSNGTVLLSGRYSENKEKEFNRFLEAVNKTDGVQAVHNFAIASSPSMASIDLTQQYAVSGTSMHEKQGYSAIINGRIYILGQSLDGMKITSIEPREILLEKDGLKYKIDYTR